MASFCKYLLLLVVTASFFTSSCGKKKKASLAGEEKVEINDFIESFPEVLLPFSIADSSLRKKGKDSVLISRTVLLQFIPDSIINKLVGKGVKYTAHPIGRAMDDNGSSYLFLKTVAGDKKAVHLLTFNKKQEFLAALNLLEPDNNNATAQFAGLDKGFSISKSVSEKKADGSVNEGKDAYVLNEETRSFTLIMIDAVVEKTNELINPIDTLPRKHKYAGDYSSGKQNIVSVRDGNRTDKIMIFVSFAKEEDGCSGEIKGDAFWKSENVAEYRAGDSEDACMLRLTFSGASVQLLEENCGSKRSGLNCSFNGSFAKVKVKKTADEKDKKEKTKLKAVKK